MNIDGVFSGGGIRGFALIGAIQAIEKNGFSFTRVAGTSAGAILASFIAVGYSADDISQIIEEVDLEQFLDSRKSIFPTNIAKWLLLYCRMGIYKGQALEKWLQEKFLEKGIRVFGDLPQGALRVVASDLTNGRMMILPDDLPKYGYNPNEFSVARAVRMSAGLPFFFEPMAMEKENSKPIIVDGGILSNFPLWLFDQTKNESIRPLLGIQLSPKIENRPARKINNAIELFHALFETMMDAHDLRYISKSIEKNIIFIPVDNVVTREFNIKKEKKAEMVEMGYKRAEEFLKHWSY